MEDLEQMIDRLHLEDLRNDVHPSVFDENEAYDMMIIRLPLIKEELEVLSLGFVLTPQRSYFYNREEQRFNLLEGRFEGPYRIIDKLADSLLKSFAKYQELTADMEEALYTDRATEGFMTTWLGFKRDILRIERILLRTSGTLKEVIAFYESTESFPINSYIDLEEHVDRTLRSATLQLSKLDYLYNFYSARTNERMNRLIYALTIISAIFLPLNLVVGFFGMNTSGLPFAGGAHGTLGAVALMMSLMVATSAVIYLWKAKNEKN